MEWLRQYYYVGGMPAAVVSFAEKKDFVDVRTIQKKILDAYESDFSKHAPVEIVPRIRLVWNSILPQLTKENRKFMYAKIQKGAITEQFVFQQLTQNGNLVIAYWTSESLKAEIDLLIQYSNDVIPIEVTAAENLQAKSLKTFCQKYNPETAIRTSLSDYRKETWLTNVPLYIIGNYFDNNT